MSADSVTMDPWPELGPPLDLDRISTEVVEDELLYFDGPLLVVMKDERDSRMLQIVDRDHHGHVRGWRDGAGYHAMREEFTEHKTRPDLKAEYELGYADGRRTAHAAAEAAAARHGYEPIVVRPAGRQSDEEPP